MSENFIQKPCFREHLAVRLNKDLQNQLEEAFIQALKLKGYEFEHPLKLYQFVKGRCECHHYLLQKEKVYSVDGMPFFLHKYESVIDAPDFDENNVLTIK